MSKGSWSISDDFLKCIVENTPKESCILEFGSGDGTYRLLQEGYKLLSIEQNIKWCGLHHDNYCHCPLVDGWYDMDKLGKFLEGRSYDVILIDGPAAGDRIKILESCVDLSKTLFVDDLDRPKDRELFNKLKENRRFLDKELYGVIFNA